VAAASRGPGARQTGQGGSAASAAAQETLNFHAHFPKNIEKKEIRP
jgi:hypothetical protein